MRRKIFYIGAGLGFACISAAALVILATYQSNTSEIASRKYFLVKIINSEYPFPIPVDPGTKISEFLESKLKIKASAVYAVINHKKTLLDLNEEIHRDASWEVVV